VGLVRIVQHGSGEPVSVQGWLWSTSGPLPIGGARVWKVCVGPACGTAPSIAGRAGLAAAPLDVLTASASTASRSSLIDRLIFPAECPKKTESDRGSAGLQRCRVPGHLSHGRLERGDRAAEIAGVGLQSR